MRILSGQYKNHQILSPHSTKTHPMGDREKLALFNSLLSLEKFEAGLADKRILDAFAGSGALGLEALSRGATDVAFVEKDAHAAQTIRANLSALGAHAQVVKQDINQFTTTAPFDLIFADPPYDALEELNLPHLLSLLTPAGVLVLSLPKSARLDPPNIIKDKTYARCRIVFLNKI